MPHHVHPPHFYRQALLQRFSPYSALSLEWLDCTLFARIFQDYPPAVIRVGLQCSVLKLFCDSDRICLSVESVDMYLYLQPELRGGNGGRAKQGGSVLRGSKGGRRQPSLRPIHFSSARVRRTPNSPASSTCAHLYLPASAAELLDHMFGCQ